MDGSPPCSTFSLSGNREKDWGKEKVFREGQTAQVLDTLFFDFIALAKALQPKVVIAENVKVLLMGNASDEHITDDISQEGYVTSTGEDYPILKVNDLSDDNAMLEFAVIGLECDILKLSFLGRIKG